MPICHTIRKRGSNVGLTNFEYINILIYNHNNKHFYFAAVPTKTLKFYGNPDFKLPCRKEVLSQIKNNGKFKIKFGTFVQLMARDTDNYRIVYIPIDCSKNNLYSLINNQILTTNKYEIFIKGCPIGNSQVELNFSLKEIIYKIKQFNNDELNNWKETTKNMTIGDWDKGISYFFLNEYKSRPFKKRRF